MTFVDTAFVIAWVNEDDALHAKAIQLLDAYKDAPWLTAIAFYWKSGIHWRGVFARKPSEQLRTF